MPTNIIEFKKNLNGMIERKDLVLPSTVSADAFRNAAIVAFQTNPKIRQGTPESVFTALRHIAGAGLLPDGREAAIVLYKDRAQANIMVSGLRKIVRNSGMVASLWDDVVYQGEQIVFRIVDGARTWDHINEDGSPINAMTRGGKIIGAYAAAKLKDGSSEIEVMTLAEIEKRRRASPNQRGDKPEGIWADWFPEMARKTAVRALCKRLPMSSEDYNRVVNDPAFQEVPDMRDVTPQETTEERLRRIAMEKSQEEVPEDTIEAAPHPAFDENEVFPGDEAFGAGAKAYEGGKTLEDNPHTSNPDFSNWQAGWMEAREMARE